LLSGFGLDGRGVPVQAERNGMGLPLGWPPSPAAIGSHRLGIE